MISSRRFQPVAKRTVVVLLAFSLQASQVDRSEDRSQPALPGFVDVTAKSGVNFRNEPSKTSQKYLPESMVGGVAMLDYNGDGLPDLYFVNGAALEDPMVEDRAPDKSDPRFWNRLYRNDGGLKFTDVTKQAGVAGHSYGQGVAAGDYDNDGDPDLYVTNYGRNILYRNNGDGTFTDRTRQAGVAAGGWSAGALFIDYDLDGHLDLAVARYVEWDFTKAPWCGERKPGYRSYCHPDHFEPVAHLLFRNNGDGTFADVSQESGFGSAPGKGLGIALNDFDRDGHPDIFIANDSFAQQLFHNGADGTFEEVGLLAGLAYDEDGKTFAGMGTDFLDYDNDGRADVFVNALANQKYALFRNADGVFEYLSGSTGVSAASERHSGWGTKLIDYDNDGWKDLFVAQGHVMDNIELTQPSIRYREPFLLLRNVEGRFENVSAKSGPLFTKPRASRGAAFGDLDNDGSLDIAVNCNDERAVIARNTGGGNRWLVVQTIGTVSNRDGIGARLRLVTGIGPQQHHIVSTGGSYLSTSDKRVHFGVGRAERVKLLEITWPSGAVQQLRDVRTNQFLTIEEPAAQDPL